MTFVTREQIKEYLRGAAIAARRRGHPAWRGGKTLTAITKHFGVLTDADVATITLMAETGELVGYTVSKTTVYRLREDAA